MEFGKQSYKRLELLSLLNKVSMTSMLSLLFISACSIAVVALPSLSFKEYKESTQSMRLLISSVCLALSLFKLSAPSLICLSVKKVDLTRYSILLTLSVYFVALLSFGELAR